MHAATNKPTASEPIVMLHPASLPCRAPAPAPALPPCPASPPPCPCPPPAVVYLDADTIAVRPTDELFLCDGLCGVMRHSERINTGALPLPPPPALLRRATTAWMPTRPHWLGSPGIASMPQPPLPATGAHNENVLP